MPAYDDLNATDLIRRWRQIVNNNTTAGRDGALLKKFLLEYSPIQVLLGIYQHRNQRTISILQFIRQVDSWIEPDLEVAKIELACEVALKCPPDYYICKDLVEAESAADVKIYDEAYERLRAWAEGVLS